MVLLISVSLLHYGSTCRSGDSALTSERLSAAHSYWSSLANAVLIELNAIGVSHYCRFDKDGSGNIDADELRQALESFGYRL